MNGKNKIPARLSAGFAIVMLAAIVLLRRPGAAHVVTGIVWGMVVALLGLLIYYIVIPRPGVQVKSFIRGYLPGALLRYVIMICAFCAVVFWLKINAVGVLLGAFAGMMTATFISLNKMRHPEA
ncbi:MAG: hypothetical protein ABSF80_03960 [Chitinispirillaceae bacterium]|jgi:hypothetical protein